MSGRHAIRRGSSKVRAACFFPHRPVSVRCARHQTWTDARGHGFACSSLALQPSPHGVFTAAGRRFTDDEGQGNGRDIGRRVEHQRPRITRSTEIVQGDRRRGSSMGSTTRTQRIRAAVAKRSGVSSGRGSGQTAYSASLRARLGRLIHTLGEGVRSSPGVRPPGDRRGQEGSDRSPGANPWACLSPAIH